MVFIELSSLDKAQNFIHTILYFGPKKIAFAAVGTLSLYPTITYVLWAVPLSKGKLPEVSSNLVSRLKTIINIEILGFASIPFLATLMSRGVGLN